MKLLFREPSPENAALYASRWDCEVRNEQADNDNEKHGERDGIRPNEVAI